MRLLKKGVAIALAAAMVVTLAPADNAGAAKKKPKLNKTSESIAVGAKVKLTVKNGVKKAKVTWKASNKKVKLSKKVKQGNKASVVVTGVSKGSAKVTAAYKLGKKTTKLNCKIKVSAVTDTAASSQPANSAAASASASAAATSSAAASTTPASSGAGASSSPAASSTAKASSTPKASKTPKPTPTPEITPTPLPSSDASVEFQPVTNAIPIDVSTFKVLNGTGKYNEKTKSVEINDADKKNSHGTWKLPDTIPEIKTGDIVTFRVQGYNYGKSGFRFWIGTEGNGGCTPVMLVDKPDEKLLIKKELGYPTVYDAEGNLHVGKKGSDIQNDTICNQMAINADPTTKAFDVTFSFKAGTSQDDTDGQFPNLTIKYIFGGGTSGYIDGLRIKNIYYIKGGVQPTASEKPVEPTEVPGPAEGYTRYNKAADFEAGSSYVLAFNNAVAGAIDKDKKVGYSNVGDLYAMSDTNEPNSYVKIANDKIASDRSYADSDSDAIAWLAEGVSGKEGVFTLKNVKSGKFLKIASSGIAFADTADDECEFKLVERTGEEQKYMSLTSVKDDTKFVRISNGNSKFSVGSSTKSTDGRNGSIYLYKADIKEK